MVVGGNTCETGSNVSYLLAAVLFWVGLLASAWVYNSRRRRQQRCANIACSRQSRDLERVTIPAVVEGITIDVRLCPDCWALYRRWATR